MAATPPPTPELPKPSVQPAGTTTADAAPAGAPTGAPLPGSATGVALAPPEVEDPLAHELGFWRQPWVQDILPFATSLAIHLGLIIIGIATYQAATHIASTLKAQIIVPDATMATDPGGIPNPGMGPDAEKPAAQDVDPSITKSDGTAESKSDLNTMLMNTPGGGNTDDAGTIIGLGAAGGIGKHGQGGGVGEGNGSGGGGQLAVFGIPGGGGGIGPRGRVFGHGGNALKIVYICDASGSMMSKMDSLKIELQKSVNGLQPIQAFDVLFFQDTVDNPKHYIDLAPDLIAANSDNKKKLNDFLQDIVGRSSTHVIPALTQVFHMKTRPDLIYLLTDGAFEDEGGKAVIEAIDKLNPDHKIKVNPILFLGKDIDPDELKGATEDMTTIAHKNGGQLNTVNIDELQ